MKIILNLPKSAAALAAMFLADDYESEVIEATIKLCEENPTEIDISNIKEKLDLDDSDMQAFNMGLALIAISMRIDEVKNQKEDKK